MEQLWRERQRARYMEEQRLGYTGAPYAHGYAQPQVAQQAQAAAPDVASRVQQLKSLLDQGLITQAEFEARKAEILRSI
jgi:membrane protease subunit (stomatin/prohibitin family)